VPPVSEYQSPITCRRRRFRSTRVEQGAAIDGESNEYVRCVAYSPDGKRLASAGGYRARGEVKVWDATQWDEGPHR